MRKKILIVLAAIAAIIVVFAVIVALQPSEVRVVRTVTIAAPAPAVFAQVNDFHKWEAWSPGRSSTRLPRSPSKVRPRDKAPSSPGPATMKWARGA